VLALCSLARPGRLLSGIEGHPDTIAQAGVAASAAMISPPLWTRKPALAAACAPSYACTVRWRCIRARCDDRERDTMPRMRNLRRRLPFGGHEPAPFTFDQVMAQVDTLVDEALWWPVRETDFVEAG
jgi:hypothetical protein